MTYMNANHTHARLVVLTTKSCYPKKLPSHEMALSNLAIRVALALLVLPCSTALKINIWTNATDSTFLFPETSGSSDFGIQELIHKPSLGIALSGGGWRAAPFAYGVLRGLYLVRGAMQTGALLGQRYQLVSKSRAPTLSTHRVGPLAQSRKATEEVQMKHILQLHRPPAAQHICCATADQQH